MLRDFAVALSVLTPQQYISNRLLGSKVLGSFGVRPKVPLTFAHSWPQSL